MKDDKDPVLVGLLNCRNCKNSTALTQIMAKHMKKKKKVTEKLGLEGT